MSSFNIKKGSLGSEFLKKTAGYISGAASSYFREAAPASTSVITGLGSAAKSVSSSIIDASHSVLSTAKRLKQQSIFKSITNWYLDKESTLGDGFDDSSLSFDSDVDDAGGVITAEYDSSSQQVSRSVVESTQQLVESQIAATSNLLDGMNATRQVIDSGFRETNATLGQILEVLTTNTATLIEVGVANSMQQSANDQLISSSKFDWNAYKEQVMKNIDNSALGMLKSFLPLFLDPENFKAENIVETLFNTGMDRLLPNIKKGVKAFDQTLNDVIMDSLIHLGENQYSILDPRGMISEIFGLKSDRNDIVTARDALELKAVPFDSVVRESIVTTIPEYLSKILVAVGGEDVTYDYRYRSFRSRDDIAKEFSDQLAANNMIYGASDQVRNAVGYDEFSSMIYDLMINQMSGGWEDVRARLGEMSSSVDSTRDYIRNTLLQGQNLSDLDIANIDTVAGNIHDALQGTGARDIRNQIARFNINRNRRGQQFVSEADRMGVDLSYIYDNWQMDHDTILRRAIPSPSMNDEHSDVSNNIISSGSALTGVNYTNTALYEIFRRLDTGINVFKVGEREVRTKPYKKMDKHLPKPAFYQARVIQDQNQIPMGFSTNEVQRNESSPPSYNPSEANLLQNNVLEDGTKEELGVGARVARWGSARGGALANALFRGSAADIRAEFTNTLRDVSQVAGEGIKKGTSYINTQFGNVGGYIKHKLFGTEYTYQDGTDEEGNPIMKKVATNEKGGIFGFVKDNIIDTFSNTKNRAQKWFSTVAGYFDYKVKGEDSSAATKRKKLLAVSVGALAGAGILGGPIGLLMGGIAGNALYGLDIGTKIKSFFFGRDENGKAKGLFTKISDTVLDPIKFQIDKTINHVGNILKKNVFGPISDIGLAIKARVTGTVDSVFKKYVTKPIANVVKTVVGGFWNGFKKTMSFIWSPFKKIGSMLLSPFKKAHENNPGGLIGNLVRGAASVAGGFTGFGLNRVAGAIAGGGAVRFRGHEFFGGRSLFRDRTISGYDSQGNPIYTNDLIRQRRRERQQEIDDNRGRFANIGRWREARNLDRTFSRTQGSLEDYTSETSEEVVNNTANIDRNTAEVAANTTAMVANTTNMVADIAELTHEATTAGSLYTHDKGIHERLDKIMNFFSKGKGMDSPNLVPNSNDGNSLSESFIPAASNIITSGDVVTSEENRMAKGIVDKSVSNEPDKAGIVSRFKALLDSQKRKSDIETEKEEKPSLLSTIWDKVKGLGGVLLGGVSGLIGAISGLGPILAAIAAIGLGTGTLGNTLQNIGTSISNLWDYVINGPSEDNQNAALNLATSPFDIRTNNALDYVAGPMYHVQTDAAGNDVENLSAENARNQMIGNMIRRDVTGTGAVARTNLRTNGQLNNLMRTSATARGIGSVGGSLATGMLTGGAFGLLSSSIASKMGMDEDQVAIAGNAGNAVGQIVGTTRSMNQNSMYAKLKTQILETLDKVITKVLDMKIVKKVGGAVIDIIKSKYTAFKSLLTKVLEKASATMIGKMLARANMVLAKDAVGVGTAGIVSGIFGVGGAIQGGFTAANLFRVPSNQVDWLMRTIATGLGAIFWGFPLAGLFEVADIVLEPMAGITVRSFLAEMIYNALESVGVVDEGSLENKQNQLIDGLNRYNEINNTNLGIDEYNDIVNRGAISQFIHGKTVYDENGNLVLNEDGSVATKGGWLTGRMNVLQKEIAEETGIGAEISSSVDDWANDEYITDDKGNKIRIEDEDLRKSMGDSYVKKESLGTYITATLNKVTNSLMSPIDIIAKAITEWQRTQAPWKGAVTATSAASKLLSGSMGSALGVVSKGISNMMQYAANTMNANQGGPDDEDIPDLDPNGVLGDNNIDTEDFGGMFDPFLMASSVAANADKLLPGGNPLSKPYRVTSKFGWRTTNSDRGTELHKGIDIAPQLNPDGTKDSDADVGARYSGTVDYVKADVPDSDTAYPDSNGTYHYAGKNSTGNMVRFITDDGLLISNMHLKAGSIPSNIKEGARVKIGDKIGKMGSTGWSTGPHLHYQIENPKGNYLDPESGYLSNSSGSSEFADNGNGYYQPGISSITGMDDSTSNSGVLTRFISKIKSLGTSYLSKITGGLLGEEDSDSTNSEEAINGVENGVLTTNEGAITLTVPDQYGTVSTYEKELIDPSSDSHGWGYSQGEMRRDAILNNRIRPMNAYGLENVATIDDRMMIATTPNIGNQLPVEIGDHVDVKFKDGTVWNSIIGDAKNISDDGANEWGHNEGKSTTEIIYWDYYHNPKNVAKKVESITKTGVKYPNREIGSQGIVNNEDLGAPDDSIVVPAKQNTDSVRRQNLLTDATASVSNKMDMTVAEISSKLEDMINPSIDNINITKSDSSLSSNIIDVLTQILFELKNIANNTGSSSAFLEAINEKDFTDNELRNALSKIKLNKPKTGSFTGMLNSSSSAQGVIGMARP